MATANLKSMSIDKLSKLKDQVDAVLATKVAHDRRTLQAELGKLSRYGGGGIGAKGMRGGLRGSVAPKYRNPDNPAETWAGRGLKPRWLAAGRGGAAAPCARHRVRSRRARRSRSPFRAW